MIATLALLLGLTSTAAGLERRVSDYWDLLVARDKASAFELVAREARNHFIQRREPAMRSWKLVEIRRESETEALVTVEVERAFPGISGFHASRVLERWVLEEGQWRALVRPADTAQILKQFQSGPSQAPEAGSLRVVPEVLRIHFLDRLQTGGVRLANGLPETVRIEEVEYDHALFELREAPEEVPPGSFRDLVLKYVGDDIAKDLSSRMTISVRLTGGLQSFQVPILYNYLSPGARALFGLDAERAEKLRRGDPLRPAIAVPGAGKVPEELRKALEERRPPRP